MPTVGDKLLSGDTSPPPRGGTPPTSPGVGSGGGSGEAVAAGEASVNDSEVVPVVTDDTTMVAELVAELATGKRERGKRQRQKRAWLNRL